MTLDLELMEVESVLANGLSIVKEKAAERQVVLKLQVGETLGSMLADQRRIKQIIYNLLSNAVKFTPGTRHRQTMRSHRTARRDRELEHSVAYQIEPAAARDRIPHAFSKFRSTIADVELRRRRHLDCSRPFRNWIRHAGT